MRKLLFDPTPTFEGAVNKVARVGEEMWAIRREPSSNDRAPLPEPARDALSQLLKLAKRLEISPKPRARCVPRHRESSESEDEHQVDDIGEDLNWYPDSEEQGRSEVPSPYLLRSRVRNQI
ncbi:unnamed protein product [Nezara viridula]|uniref:Uncharacterized protein n=1 Tax=Nezara viridula TaxID=85310 RepID=A0A9P0H7H7_NEZVI|nr:unnamed protein product [Nezara viridula]